MGVFDSIKDAIFGITLRPRYQRPPQPRVPRRLFRQPLHSRLPNHPRRLHRNSLWWTSKLSLRDLPRRMLKSSIGKHQLSTS